LIFSIDFWRLLILIELNLSIIHLMLCFNNCFINYFVFKSFVSFIYAYRIDFNILNAFYFSFLYFALISFLSLFYPICFSFLFEPISLSFSYNNFNNYLCYFCNASFCVFNFSFCVDCSLYILANLYLLFFSL